MTHRQPRTSLRKDLPKIWLMTDERFGDDLLRAIKALRFGSGVIFRHYRLPEPERRKLFRQVRQICRQRGHVLILADTEAQALRWRADGFHSRQTQRQSKLLRSASVHDCAELRLALRNRADLVLISPLTATTSHPGERPLGKSRFNALAAQSDKAAVIALGGVTAQKAALLNRKKVHGWAAIDAFRK
jgi:thiamine-phosphate pyrophosphorylase